MESEDLKMFGGKASESGGSTVGIILPAKARSGDIRFFMYSFIHACNQHLHINHPTSSRLSLLAIYVFALTS